MEGIKLKIIAIHVPTGKTLVETTLSSKEAAELMDYLNNSEVFSVKIPINGENCAVILRKSILDECVFSLREIPTSR